MSDWLVAFVDQPAPWAWWHAFTARGYRHVLALRFDPSTRTWLMFDWARNGFKVEVVDRRVASWVLQEGWAAGGVLEVEQEIGRQRHGPRIAIFYCVTAIVHLLGVRALVLTPKQLYRALLRRGARPFLPIDGGPDGRVRVQAEETSA